MPATDRAISPTPNTCNPACSVASQPPLSYSVPPMRRQQTHTRMSSRLAIQTYTDRSSDAGTRRVILVLTDARAKRL